jgi:predicted alpha-1,2-mannosidase
VKLACVSKHLEYTYQDWCIGKLAEILGDSSLAEKNFEASKKVWNLWREDLKLFAPRKANGEFDYSFDPEFMRPDPWHDSNFYEASAWQWMYSVHHDFKGLIERCGGKEEFVCRLDRFFDEGHYHSKETMLHIPYLYIYAGIPEKTFERVRECLTKYYRNTRNGISDNEDMGCQSAFFMCSSMGIYPIMGQDLYMLTAPIFDRITLQMGKGGKQLEIKAKRKGLEDKYIVGARLNGEVLDRAWIRHEEIANGGILELTLDEKPNGWGNGELPPCPMDIL